MPCVCCQNPSLTRLRAQEAWSKHLPFSHLAAATGATPTAEVPASRIATKRGPPPPSSGAWERTCRPRRPSDCAAQAPAPPAAVRVAPNSRSVGGPRRPLHAESSGGNSERGPVREGAASDPSHAGAHAPPPADGPSERGGGAPAQADGASGWVFWAGWVAAGCGGDGCWCCSPRAGRSGGSDSDDGGPGDGAAADGGRGEGDLGPCAAPTADAWPWSLPRVAGPAPAIASGSDIATPAAGDSDGGGRIPGRRGRRGGPPSRPATPRDEAEPAPLPPGPSEAL